MNVAEKLNAMGWAHGETGGGCTCYSKNTSDPHIGGGHPDGWYWMLTDAMDPIAPTEPDQMITLGLYDEDGMPIIMLTFSLLLILSGLIVIEDFYGGK